MSSIDWYTKYMDGFNGEKVAGRIVDWIRSWFDENGKGCNAVIGISGGKDSTVAAALCAQALGSKKVFGVLMPQDTQLDINDSEDIVKFLGINRLYFNIGCTCDMIADNVDLELAGGREYITETSSILREHEAFGRISKQALINLPPRIRMATLYAFSQSLNGRVVNTCNLSEDYVGYATRWGDSCGDFAPLKSLTTDEVIAVGRALGIPERFLVKAPADGLCGKTDEENLGFTYRTLNKYIRLGEISDKDVMAKIDNLHKINSFKERTIDRFVLE